MFQKLNKYQAGGTLYDYLKSSGIGWSGPNSKERKQLAAKAGIKNYSATKEQNIQLLNYLQSANNPVVGHKTPTLEKFLANTPNTVQAMPGSEFGSVDPRSTFGVLPQSNLSFLQDKPKVDMSFLNNFGKGLTPYQQGGTIARKVDSVPDGFNPLRVDGNKSYYNKVGSNSFNLNASASGPRATNDSTYMQGLAQKYPGVDGNTLQQRGFLSSDGAKAFTSFYKPTEDVVYTERQPQQSPTPAKTSRGLPVYDGQKHISAELFYPTRDSMDSSQGGNLNTQNSGARLKFRNDFGYTGEEIQMAAPDIQKYLGTTNTFQSADGLTELRNRAKSPIATKKKGGWVNKNKNPYC